jgi:hypothetical protein
MNLPKKIYIGDSVYAKYDGWSITLTTENGYPDDPRNEIVMEPEVIEGFFSFVEAIKAQVKAEREAKGD